MDTKTKYKHWNIIATSATIIIDKALVVSAVYNQLMKKIVWMSKGFGLGCSSEAVHVVPLQRMLCLATSTAWLGLGQGQPRIEILVRPSVWPAAKLCHPIWFHNKVGRSSGRSNAWLPYNTQHIIDLEFYLAHRHPFFGNN